MALFFCPCKLANISIKPQFTPANLCSAVCDIRAICILESDKLYNSLRANKTAHSTAAELERPAPSGILPCMQIEKPPLKSSFILAKLFSLLDKLLSIVAKLLNTWSTTPII